MINYVGNKSFCVESIEIPQMNRPLPKQFLFHKINIIIIKMNLRNAILQQVLNFSVLLLCEEFISSIIKFENLKLL